MHEKVQLYDFGLTITHYDIRMLTVLFSRYIYTDSYDAISLANVVEVLAASKKYLLAKLTRYCYGFIQNNMTAENSVSLWFLVLCRPPYYHQANT